MYTRLQTERLSLRPLERSDAANIVTLLGHDWEAAKQMASMPFPCTLANVQEWIALRIGPQGTSLAVVRQSDGAFIGSVGFGNDKGAAELAIRSAARHGATVTPPRPSPRSSSMPASRVSLRSSPMFFSITRPRRVFSKRPASPIAV